jgi:hypothetical protein
LHGLDLPALGFCVTDRRANDEGRRNESQKGQVPAAWLVVSFRDGMNRTPIASPLLLVGRDTIESKR